MTRAEKRVAISLCDGWARYGDGPLKNPRPDEFSIPMGKSTRFDPEDLKKATIVTTVLDRVGPNGRPGGRLYRLLIHVHRYGQSLELFPMWQWGGGFDDPTIREKIEADREMEKAWNKVLIGLGLAGEDVLKRALLKLYSQVYAEWQHAPLEKRVRLEICD
jgi:hypothetical protein